MEKMGAESLADLVRFAEKLEIKFDQIGFPEGGNSMSESAAVVLSSQESAIESGKKVVHGTVTDRVLRMYEAIRAYGPPRVTLDRAVLFTESFKETENQPLVLRWAKALKHFAEKAPVTIFPDELIVGRPNTWFGRWGIVYPELDGSVMPAGVEMFRKNKGKPGEVVVTEEDAKIINEVLTPYWTGKDYCDQFRQGPCRRKRGS